MDDGLDGRSEEVGIGVLQELLGDVLPQTLVCLDNSESAKNRCRLDSCTHRSLAHVLI